MSGCHYYLNNRLCGQQTNITVFKFTFHNHRTPPLLFDTGKILLLIEALSILVLVQLQEQAESLLEKCLVLAPVICLSLTVCHQGNPEGSVSLFFMPQQFAYVMQPLPHHP